MEKIKIEKMSKVQEILGSIVLFMTTNSLYTFLYIFFLCPNQILMFIMEKLICTSVFKNSI